MPSPTEAVIVDLPCVLAVVVRLMNTRGVALVVANAALLVLSLALDLRDLVYKTLWIGPFDAYAFDGRGDHVLDERQLIPAAPGNATGASGWRSFFAPCSTLSGSSFFLSALGTNCTVSDTVVVPQLVMTGTIRVDAVAWACCQLLWYDRRPPVCHTPMVKQFLRRYAMEKPRIPRTATAVPQSPAELELHRMLGVIGRISCLSRAVCVEAFALHGVGSYRPTIYGCGSPDAYEAAFAGVHATHVALLLSNLAWLTIDDLNVMGLRFAVRQNDLSEYAVYINSNNRTVATHHPRMNYSSSGHLYPLVVFCDVVILVYQVLSAIQVVRVLLLPHLRFVLGTSTQSVSFFSDSSWLALVSRSLLRSRPIALLTVVSQLLSWQLIMPNAVIWTWTNESSGRWQALLSSLRVWELFLIALLWFWEVMVVVMGERATYACTHRTFISVPEIVAVAALFALVRRDDFMSIGDHKYAYDRQRLSDWTSFQGAGGYANTYNADHNVVRSSAEPYWDVVYAPLLRLGLFSLAGCIVLLLFKTVYYGYSPRTVHARAYERLPVEMLLDVPVRSLSLVRARWDMELKNTYIYPPLYFAFGSIVDVNGELVDRVGFARAIPPCIDLTARVVVGDSMAGTGSTLMRGGMPLMRGMSSLSGWSKRRASLRFVGRTDPTSRVSTRHSHSDDESTHSETRWAQRRRSFNVPVH